MTARQWAGCLVVLTGAAARELGLLLLCVADVMDPPQVSPREKALRAAVAAGRVPDVVPAAWVEELS